MKLVERPARGSRTPETEAAYVLTELQKMFVEMAERSPTWPREKNPSTFFEDVFKKHLHFAEIDADRDAEEFFVNARESKVDLNDLLLVAIAYCADAIRKYHKQRETEAWSMVNSAFYWLGLLKVQIQTNLSDFSYLQDQRNSGKNGALKRWAKRDTVKAYAKEQFKKKQWRSKAEGVRKILNDVCKKAEEVGFSYSTDNIERTIQEWVASKDA